MDDATGTNSSKDVNELVCVCVCVGGTREDTASGAEATLTID
jgi:hypothetical protein